MNKNLFGEKIIKEDKIGIIYRGPSFGDRMELKSLYRQLEASEAVIKNTIDALRQTGKVDFSSNDAEIFLKLRRGSFWEEIQIVLSNPIFQTVISACIIATCKYFLKKKSNQGERFQKEVAMFEKNKDFKADLKKIVSPINAVGDQVTIVGDNNTVIIKQEQKEDFYHSLDEMEESTELKNGEFEEELEGTIRRLDLDAPRNYYFGFNIKNGQMRIPTSVRGEFHLNDYRDIIDEPVKIKARVRYKDGVITYIEILEYQALTKIKQFPIKFGE